MVVICCIESAFIIIMDCVNMNTILNIKEMVASNVSYGSLSLTRVMNYYFFKFLLVRRGCGP